MAAVAARERDLVYPEERLPWPQTILMGVQHVMAMFGATVLVPLILGFNPNTVIFFSGIATLVFLLVTNRKVPSYLGSSFSFIGSVLVVQGATHPNHGLAFAGILVAGVIYFIIGALVHFVAGVDLIRFLMPPVVTGTVVAVFGLALSTVAVGSAQKELFTASVTFLAAALASVYLRGFPRLLPVLIGVVVGYVVSLVDPVCYNAKAACHVDFSGIVKASWVALPQFSFPDFSNFGRTVSLFWFIPIVLIAENTGHVYAIGGIMKRDLSGYLGRTFMGDGLGTTISALFGGHRRNHVRREHRRHGRHPGLQHLGLRSGRDHGDPARFHPQVRRPDPEHPSQRPGRDRALPVRPHRGDRRQDLGRRPGRLLEARQPRCGCHPADPGSRRRRPEDRSV